MKEKFFNQDYNCKKNINLLH